MPFLFLPRPLCFPSVRRPRYNQPTNYTILKCSDSKQNAGIHSPTAPPESTLGNHGPGKYYWAMYTYTYMYCMCIMTSSGSDGNSSSDSSRNSASSVQPSMVNTNHLLTPSSSSCSDSIAAACETCNYSDYNNNNNNNNRRKDGYVQPYIHNLYTWLRTRAGSRMMTMRRVEYAAEKYQHRLYTA